MSAAQISGQVFCTCQVIPVAARCALPISPSLSNCKLSIIGSNVAALAMLRHLRGQNSANYNFMFHESKDGTIDHDFLFLQNFIRKFNEESYDTSLTPHYGWTAEPIKLDWKAITIKFKNEFGEYKQKILDEFSSVNKFENNFMNIADNIAENTIFSVSESFYLNSTSASFLNKEIAKVRKSTLSVFDEESIENSNILICGNNNLIFDFSFFLAKCGAKMSHVVVSEEVTETFSDSVLEVYKTFMQDNGIVLHFEKDMKNASDEEISNFLNMFDKIYEFPALRYTLPEAAGGSLVSSANTWPSRCEYDLSLQQFIATKLVSRIMDDSGLSIAKDSFFFNLYPNMTSFNTPMELSSIGLSNSQIEAIKSKGNSIAYSNQTANILEHGLSFGSLPSSSIFVTYIESTQEIIRIEIFSPYSSTMLRGLIDLYKYDVKLSDFPSNIGIHPTFMENIFKDLNIGDNLSASAGCAT
ncbi:MAG: hypothetical protein MHMPM18_000771 [Marteilia pararefringens]